MSSVKFYPLKRDRPSFLSELFYLFVKYIFRTFFNLHTCSLKHVYNGKALPLDSNMTSSWSSRYWYQSIIFVFPFIQFQVILPLARMSKLQSRSLCSSHTAVSGHHAPFFLPYTIFLFYIMIIFWGLIYLQHFPLPPSQPSHISLLVLFQICSFFSHHIHLCIYLELHICFQTIIC